MATTGPEQSQKFSWKIKNFEPNFNIKKGNTLGYYLDCDNDIRFFKGLDDGCLRLCDKECREGGPGAGPLSSVILITKLQSMTEPNWHKHSPKKLA